MIKKLAYPVLLLLLLGSCKSSKDPVEQYVGQMSVYTNSQHLPEVKNFKTLAVLPAHIFLNTRHPNTERTVKRTKIAKENEERWMYFYHDLFQKHPNEISVNLQPVDSTLQIMKNAGISTADLPYIDRQQLLEIFNVDAILVHEIHVNIYSSTTEDVLTTTGMVILLAGAASAGGIPRGDFSQSSSTNSIEFIKVYGRNIEKPVWSYYGNSEYSGKKVPNPDGANALNKYKVLGFPFIN